MGIEIRNEVDVAVVEARAGAVVSMTAPKILNVAEILALDVPEASMLVEGIVPASGASLIVGTAKCGKTLNGVQIAIAVASGEALYGNYAVAHPGPALVVEVDDPAGDSSVKSILERSTVPTAGIPFHLVTELQYEFGSALTAWLESRIADLKLRFVLLDSYTALRGSRARGSDFVKDEQHALSQLDALAKRQQCAILIVHHSSKGSSGLDWSEKAAGSYAMSASTESQIFISRFPELDAAARERLVRVRGRHSEDLEMVLRFRKDSLDFEHVLEGGAAPLYPLVLQLRAAFGPQGFSPKDVAHATGNSIATANRQLSRLCFANAVRKRGYGEYILAV